MLRRLLSVFILNLMFFAGFAHAGDARYSEALTDVVPGMGQHTYVDLLKQIFKEVRPENNGYLIDGPLSPIPSIGDPIDEQPRTVTIYSVSTLEIKADGKKKLVMLLDIPESMEATIGYAIIAVYNLDAEAKLQTLGAISYDRNTGFASDAKVALNKENDAFYIYSEHFNSNQTYGMHALFSLSKGKIVLIDNIFTLSDRFCGYTRQESVLFKPEKHKPYNDIKITVSEKTTREEEACSDGPKLKLGTRTFNRLLRWDTKAQEYRIRKSDIEKLDAENETRL